MTLLIFHNCVFGFCGLNGGDKFGDGIMFLVGGDFQFGENSLETEMFGVKRADDRMLVFFLIEHDLIKYL